MAENPKPAEATLYAKMAQIMGDLTRIPKSGENAFHKYKYATSDDVADAIRKSMAEHRLGFFASMVDVQQTPMQKGVRTRATFEFTFACGDTGATRTCRWEAEADDTSDKSINKVATAAAKYFLMKTFIVSTGDDPDADAEAGIETSRPASNHPDWVTNANVAKLLQAIRERIPGIKDAEIAKHANIPSLMEGWGKYDTGKQALETVVDNWQKAQQPAKPKETQPAEENFQQVDEKIYAAFNREPAEVLGALGIKAWSDKFKTAQDAWQAVLAHAMSNFWAMMADEVEYVEKGGQKYLEFKTLVPIRAYGRSTTFKQTVGDDWYNENGVGDFKPNEVYPINTVLVDWEAKKDDKGKTKYLSFVGLTQLIDDDEAADDPENILDKFFGEKA